MKIFITRQIPDRGVNMLKENGYAVVISPQNRVLKKEEDRIKKIRELFFSREKIGGGVKKGKWESEGG